MNILKKNHFEILKPHIKFWVEIRFGLAMVATFVRSGYFSPLKINKNGQKVTLLIHSGIEGRTKLAMLEQATTRLVRLGQTTLMQHRPPPPRFWCTPWNQFFSIFQMIWSKKKKFFFWYKIFFFWLVKFFEKFQKSNIFIIGVRALIFGPSW